MEVKMHGPEGKWFLPTARLCADVADLQQRLRPNGIIIQGLSVPDNIAGLKKRCSCCLRAIFSAAQKCSAVAVELQQVCDALAAICHQRELIAQNLSRQTQEISRVQRLQERDIPQSRSARRKLAQRQMRVGQYQQTDSTLEQQENILRETEARLLSILQQVAMELQTAISEFDAQKQKLADSVSAQASATAKNGTTVKSKPKGVQRQPPFPPHNAPRQPSYPWGEYIVSAAGIFKTS